VNDAIALHVADVGISVDTATDVAKDAADIVLLDKDLGILADGVLHGRRVFNNTMKYVFMGTSGDFGNMFSAAFGSLTLNFLPMTPSQVLLNDVLYDSSQLAIPYDRVDPEAVTRPSHWDIRMIRRFMLTFGPISSIFDFATFALMMFVFHAGEPEFQSGWFVESLATETLIVFVVRTRRVPFFTSRASAGLIASVVAIVALGCWIPYSPVAGVLGFTALPAPFFLALVGMILLYLVLVEIAKHFFFRSIRNAPPAPSKSHRHTAHRIGRRAARFSTAKRRRITGR
jgi:Mg2+-importing ATPase